MYTSFFFLRISRDVVIAHFDNSMGLAKLEVGNKVYSLQSACGGYKFQAIAREIYDDEQYR